MREGYMALYLAIVKGYSVKEAFDALTLGQKKRKRKMISYEQMNLKLF